MTTHDVTRAAVEAAPPVAFAALRVAGISLPDWVAILTMLYIILQSMFLVWRWWRAARSPKLGAPE